MRAVAVILLCGLLGCACASTNPKPASPAPSPACTLEAGGEGEVVISRRDLKLAVERQKGRQQSLGAAGVKGISEREKLARALTQVAADALWLDMAQRRGTHVSERQLDAEMKRVRRDVFIDDPELMEQILAWQGWSHAAYREHVRASYAFRRADISDAEVRSATDSLSGSCRIDGKERRWTADDSHRVFQARPSR
jgi:hypothetical protein